MDPIRAYLRTFSTGDTICVTGWSVSSSFVPIAPGLKMPADISISGLEIPADILISAALGRRSMGGVGLCDSRR